MTRKGGLSNLTWLPSTPSDGLGHAGALVGSSDDRTCHIQLLQLITNTPNRSVQLEVNLIKVTDTPAISSEVIKLPMYVLVTLAFFTSTIGDVLASL